MNTLREALQEYIDLRRGLGSRVDLGSHLPRPPTDPDVRD